MSRLRSSALLQQALANDVAAESDALAAQINADAMLNAEADALADRRSASLVSGLRPYQSAGQYSTMGPGTPVSGLRPYQSASRYSTTGPGTPVSGLRPYQSASRYSAAAPTSTSRENCSFYSFSLLVV